MFFMTKCRLNDMKDLSVSANKPTIELCSTKFIFVIYLSAEMEKALL
jgi:hypothetical protein